MKGSHNSLTFAHPKSWLAWLILPIWRCQSKSISQQAAAGVRCFDIRCAWDGSKFVGAHGPVLLKITIDEALLNIAFHNPKSYIRIILENGENDPSICSNFAEMVRHWYELLPESLIFCGRSKHGWKRIADIPDHYAFIDNGLIQHVGSMKSWWGSVFPWLWAVLHRKDVPYIPENDYPIVLTDFV